MTKRIILATALGGAIAASPAAAAVQTFATFSAETPGVNFRLMNSGTMAARTSDAILTTLAAGSASTPGAALTRFSFLLPPTIASSFTNLEALFTYSAAVAKGMPAAANGSNLQQGGIAGSFSFISTQAITVSGRGLHTRTFAAGANLLSGTFTNSVVFGAGSSAATSASTGGGNTVTFTSDFLDFAPTIERDSGLTLTSISANLHTGGNGALAGFRATAGGQFSSDPAPLAPSITTAPEPTTWALMLSGFGLTGVAARRRVVA